MQKYLYESFKYVIKKTHKNKIIENKVGNQQN